MSASVANSYEPVTSVPRSGDSGTAHYGLDERNADHLLRSIRNVSRGDEKTQAINRDFFVKAARMLLEYSELHGYDLAHILVHDFVYPRVAPQVNTLQLENLSGVYQGPYATRLREPEGLANYAGISTVMPETQGYFSILERILEFPWQPADLSGQEPYAARLSELQALAREEGISPVMPESQHDFLKFVSTLGFPVRRASLSLLDSGVLGATWRNEQWRLSLRFHGDGLVGYVLLDRTNPPEGATGKCELDDFSVDCENLDLTALLAK